MKKEGWRQRKRQIHKLAFNKRGLFSCSSDLMEQVELQESMGAGVYEEKCGDGPCMLIFFSPS